MKEYKIDASKFTTRRRSHVTMKKILVDCGYHGCNLDALYDVLTTLFDDTHIVIENFAVARANLGEYADVMVEVFATSKRQNPHLTVDIIE